MPLQGDLLAAPYIFAIVLTILAIPGYAQRSTANIAGSVQDQSGSPVPDATIVVRNNRVNLNNPAATRRNALFGRKPAQVTLGFCS